MRASSILLSVPLFCFPLLSCSTSGTGSSTPVSTVFSCGKGSLKGNIKLQDATSLGPVGGAKVAGAGCSTVSTDDRGFSDAATDKDFLIKVDLTKDGYFHEYGEVTITKDNFQASTYAFPLTTKDKIFPGYTDAQGFVAFAVSGDGSDGGACATGEGSVVTVKDHPEIKVGYLKDPGTRDPAMTATGGAGSLVVVGPMAPGSYDIVATKAGCAGTGFKDDTFTFSSTVTIKAGTLTGTSIRLLPK